MSTSGLPSPISRYASSAPSRPWKYWTGISVEFVAIANSGDQGAGASTAHAGTPPACAESPRSRPPSCEGHRRQHPHHAAPDVHAPPRLTEVVPHVVVDALVI